MVDSVLGYCADKKNGGLSMLTNAGHQIGYIKFGGIIRSSPHSLR